MYVISPSELIKFSLEISQYGFAEIEIEDIMCRIDIGNSTERIIYNIETRKIVYMPEYTLEKFKEFLTK